MAKRAACLGALRDAPGRGSGSSVFARAVARPLGGFAMMALRMGAPCPAGAGRETPLTRPVLLRQTRSARRFPGRPVRLLLGAGTAGAVLLSRAVPATPGRSQACRVSRGGQAGPRCPLRPNRRVLSPTPSTRRGSPPLTIPLASESTPQWVCSRASLSRRLSPLPPAKYVEVMSGGGGFFLEGVEALEVGRPSRDIQLHWSIAQADRVHQRVE